MNMKLTEQSRLNRGEQEAIRTILMRSHEKEPFSITFPLLEPKTRFFIARDPETDAPRAVLALSKLDDTLYEVSAFTDPDCRRQGLFRALWEKAQLALPGQSLAGGPVTVRFALDSACKAALPVLLSIGASKTSEETEMRCDLSEKPLPGTKYRFRRSAPSGEGVICYEALPAEGDKPVFRCYLMPMKDAHCYLHRIAVQKDMVGRGIGSEVFPELLGVLRKQGYKQASLQVSAENLPAIRLYEKNGFTVTTSLRYYEITF